MKSFRSKLSSRAGYTLLILALYIFGKNIPVPLVSQQTGSAAVELSMMERLLTGGGVFSVFALDLAPWMSAAIIFRLGGLARGNRSRGASATSTQRKTRYLAFFFACVNAGVRSVALISEQSFTGSVLGDRVIVSVILVAGSMLVIWMAERNTEMGIGGMISFICVNIVFNVIHIFVEIPALIRSGGGNTGTLYIIFAALAGLSILAVLTMRAFERREERIPVQRVLIDSSMEHSNYFSIKGNPVGAQALMYVMAFYMVPYLLLKLAELLFPGNALFPVLENYISLYHPIGLLLYLVLYVLTAMGLASVEIDASEIAEQMQKRGDCFKGVRPGRDTEQLIRGTVRRNSLRSALILGGIIGISLSLRLLFPFTGNMAMLPVYLMILTGITQSIVSEIKSVYAMDHYEILIDMIGNTEDE